jgi:hypothetical protein
MNTHLSELCNTGMKEILSVIDDRPIRDISLVEKYNITPELFKLESDFINLYIDTLIETNKIISNSDLKESINNFKKDIMDRLSYVKI